MKHILFILGIISVLLIAPFAFSQSADVIYKNGKIYTVNEVHDWAEAMAISNGKFIHVGAMDEMNNLISPATKVIDLEGSMVIPGINDLHAHPMDAGQKELLECGFPITLPIDKIISRLKHCAKNTYEGQWIRGARWPAEFLQSTTVPHKSLLDKASRDHPVYIHLSHGALFNSKALEVLGITRDKPGPGIEQDERGGPSGVLKGNAFHDALKRIPAYSENQNLEALRWSLTQLNKVGVTSVKEASAHGDTLKAYSTLDRSGQLTLRVASSLVWKYSSTEATEKEKKDIAQRAMYESERHDPNFIKIVLDGIPPMRTAAMLDPYVADDVHGDYFSGELKHAPEQLKQDVTQLDAQGLTVKIHATGDRSLRVSLDAFEAARKSNNNNKLIHEVAHAEFIHPDDMSRFGKLNVAAEMSPVIWYPSPLSIAAGKAVGEVKGTRIYPVKSLLEAGALVIYGSDWPSVDPVPSPWPGLEAMVTRRNPHTNIGEQFWPEQAIALTEAIEIYTQNGAVAMKKGTVSGSIETGKYADFIVLDRNLFDVPIASVSETKVLLTVFEGQVVHDARIIP